MDVLLIALAIPVVLYALYVAFVRSVAHRPSVPRGPVTHYDDVAPTDPLKGDQWHPPNGPRVRYDGHTWVDPGFHRAPPWYGS